MSRIRESFIVAVAATLLTALAQPSLATDSEWNRKTLVGIQGVYVVVEELQANLKKYAPGATLTREQLTKEVEGRLTAAGIRVLGQEEWQKTKGKPTLYVNINTHEYEKYAYAYDVSVELQQVVSMEANPPVRLLTETWSIHQTGAFKVGTVQHLREQIIRLLDRFIDAHRSANRSPK